MDLIAPADDLEAFLAMLPPNIQDAISKDTNGIYEIVMDLGRLPEARYLDRHTMYLSDKPITNDDLEAAVSRIGHSPATTERALNALCTASRLCATAAAK